ncbi:MAG: hypothetical protein R3C03_17225 [Pirellulaceae bacterium]
MNLRQVTLTLLLSYVLFTCGCRDGRPIVYPVLGIVTMRGKPVADARVMFHAESGEDALRPIAITNSEGEFEMTTSNLNDGVPEGNFVITVERRAWIDEGDERVRRGEHELPVQFSSYETSPLQACVVPGKNERLELKLDE